MLLELLTPDAQKALSATCKSCHAQFIAQVQVVTVLREDYSLVFERRWPRLRMVILQDVRCSAVDDSGLGFGLSKPSEAFRSLLEPSNYRVLKLHVATAPRKQAVICILTPLHTSATDLPCAQLAAQRLAHQLKVRWPSLRSFVMSPVDDQDVLGLEIVSQLVRGTWTGLAHLSLAGHKLKAQAFLLLSQGSWPGLTFLDVSDTCLDAEGMALLVKGNHLG